MYRTQMEAAKKNIYTKEMKEVAKKEGIAVEKLCELVAKGQVAIPANINHTNLKARGVGKNLKTKINVNLGTSRDCSNEEIELAKVQLSEEFKVDSIMDLSNYGDTSILRKKIIDKAEMMVGTVPIYDAFSLYNKELKDITAEEFIELIEIHGKLGVDFVTVHAGLNREAVELTKRNERITNIVSRGGSLLYAWMEMNNAENPYFEYFDQVLEICYKYDITLSLGDALRSGSINDATDAMQVKELITLGELTKRAWAKNVQVIIEGPGHMTMDEIEANVILQKKLCHGAPFYVLGPLVTDIAPGYDHITAAIGGAIAAKAGADFLCYVTPAEHLRLPTLEDTKEGIIAAQIAAHAADMVKKPEVKKWDNEMSKSRMKIDWENMIDLAIDSEKPREYRKNQHLHDEETCSMCGKMCSMKTMKLIMEQKEPSILS